MSELEKYYVQTAIPNANQHTGKVPNLMDTAGPETTAYKRFTLHQEDDLNKSTPYAAQSLIRIHTMTPLNLAFFSDKNINNLQQEIRYRVWLISNKKYVIDKQNDDDLKTIMRSYYLQYSPYDENNLKGELLSLNERVIAYSVDYILCEINMYSYYRKDITDFPAPISNPVNANLTGTKSAEFKRFF